METVNSILSWLSENWPLITVIVGVLIQLIQITTKHFSEYAGVKKIGAYIVELLSVFVSKNVEGVVKLPFVSKAEPKKVEKEGD